MTSKNAVDYATEHREFMLLFRDTQELFQPVLSTKFYSDTSYGEGDERVVKITATPESLALRKRQTSNISALHSAVFSSPYVKRLENIGLVENVFQPLREELRKAPGISVDDYFESVSDRDYGEKRRQLRFIWRYARIITYQGDQRPQPTPGNTNRQRKKLLETLKASATLIQSLASDRYFIASLGRFSAREFQLLPERLALISEAVQEAQPLYPYKRDKDPAHTRLKVLIDDLVECCLRTYEVPPSPSVLHALMKFPWADHAEPPSDKEIEALIEATATKIQRLDMQRVEEPAWDFKTAPDLWTPPHWL